MNKVVIAAVAAVVVTGTAVAGVMTATGAKSAARSPQHAVRPVVAVSSSDPVVGWSEPDHYRFDLGKLPCVIPSNAHLLGPAWAIEVLHRRVVSVKVLIDVPGSMKDVTALPTLGELTRVASAAHRTGSPHVSFDWRDGYAQAIPSGGTDRDPECFSVQSYQVL
ncbi:hypothetical protein ACTOB_003785 [Actinoplanes oblitus]|uniref:Secreted protein n=1 Tax=Actinoplanes oblitus TaxID=3040509 RepID=A0ABY8WRL2_9ACTN|nr:hypothetical protein [Actinoplanes oblitus]WIN00103.1 hypothetical protein ACTOB_003785 [Actinoplanes oblitus]